MPHRKVSRYPRYVERDESWMYFNQRLLEEAQREDIPLLERFNYLGIYSSNLDEFVRVRVANLRRLAEYNKFIPQEERKIARQTLVKIARMTVDYSARYEEVLARLFAELERERIHIVNETQLRGEQEEYVRHFYMEHIAGLVNPIFLSSPSFVPEQHLKDALYLVVVPHRHRGDRAINLREVAIVQIPSKDVGRFLRLPDQGEDKFLMLLDDVLRYCLPYIFAGMHFEAFEAYTFKFTKDSELELDSDLRSSVIDQVSQGLKRRNRGEPIRLVYDAQMPQEVLDLLCQSAVMSPSDIKLGGGRYHDMKDLMKMPDCGRRDLRFAPWSQTLVEQSIHSSSVLDQILHKDMGIHFPYESFSSFVRVLQEAAISPEVNQIYISLYRVAQDSRVVKALMAAAQNGKQVTAVVELLARFDEKSNINWSKRMQEAGVNVVFGHKELKVHCKLALISTRRGDIACISTGNMHESTAKLYTDYMLLTAHKGIAADVRRVFNFIELPFYKVRFKQLLVSPNDMRRQLYYLINQEIKYAERNPGEAWIKLKINHIVDERMVQKLYEAADAGVRIEACVRGNCSIMPYEAESGGYIRLNAIIDRYLEHARIYIFASGGRPKYFLGSSDWMPRNLDRRVEVMTPVYDPQIQEELRMIVDYGLKDTTHGHTIAEAGGVPRRGLADGGEPFRSQEALYLYYQSQNNPE